MSSFPTMAPLHRRWALGIITKFSMQGGVPMLSVEQVLSALFEEAARTTRLDYLYTLVRVEGITQRIDPLVDLLSILNDYFVNPPQRENILSTYRSLVQNHEPLSLLANLIYCVDNKNFMTQPFFVLVKGTFPNQI
jgi:hypothetical protein